ncbi:hypothetical protein FRC02_005226 [Tulasnella sp. 418]|nr:hypothetical protein FRC02_005226 [Tulasnella sp. 418]
MRGVQGWKAEWLRAHNGLDRGTKIVPASNLVDISRSQFGATPRPQVPSLPPLLLVTLKNLYILFRPPSLRPQVRVVSLSNPLA